VALLMAFGVFWAGERTAPLFLGVLVLLMILGASRLQFAREWFALGRFLGSTLEVRKAARYALALSQWFELEAERTRSPQRLWEDFGFLLRKLGYTRVLLRGPGNQERLWATDAPPPAPLRRTVIRLPHPGGLELVFEAPEAIPERVFDLNNELAAEAWAKALDKCGPLEPETLFASPAGAPAPEPTKVAALPPA